MRSLDLTVVRNHVQKICEKNRRQFKQRLTLVKWASGECTKLTGDRPDAERSKTSRRTRGTVGNLPPCPLSNLPETAFWKRKKKCPRKFPALPSYSCIFNEQQLNSPSKLSHTRPLGNNLGKALLRRVESAGDGEAPSG